MNSSNDAVKKGGGREYIKDDTKSATDRKRPFSDHERVICRLTLTPRADHILTQLSMILDLPKGRVATYAVEIFAMSYNAAVKVLDSRPDLDDLLDELGRAFLL